MMRSIECPLRIEACTVKAQAKELDGKVQHAIRNILQIFASRNNLVLRQQEALPEFLQNRELIADLRDRLNLIEQLAEEYGSYVENGCNGYFHHTGNRDVGRYPVTTTMIVGQ